MTRVTMTYIEKGQEESVRREFPNTLEAMASVQRVLNCVSLNEHGPDTVGERLTIDIEVVS